MTDTAGGADSLAAVAVAGFCVDEWDRWQQGMCGTYAHALLTVAPHLRLGVLGQSDGHGWRLTHFFAHDDAFAYDSAGRHPLPYRGIRGDHDVAYLDQPPGDYALLEEDGADDADVAAASAHAARNAILTGRYRAR